MKNFRFLILVFLASCYNQISDWSAIGGSRADGTVRMAYEVGELATNEEPDWGRGKELARRRCQSWGYQDADPFGGKSRQCLRRGGLSGCSHWQITMEFQCVGGQVPNPIPPTMNYPNNYPQQGQWRNWE